MARLLTKFYVDDNDCFKIHTKHRIGVHLKKHVIGGEKIHLCLTNSGDLIGK